MPIKHLSKRASDNGLEQGTLQGTVTSLDSCNQYL